jgi:hypothetical protein
MDLREEVLDLEALKGAHIVLVAHSAARFEGFVDQASCANLFPAY